MVSLLEPAAEAIGSERGGVSNRRVWAAAAMGWLALAGCSRDEARPAQRSAAATEEVHAATSAAQAAASYRAVAGAERDGLLRRDAKEWPKPGRYERTLEIEKIPRRYLVQLPGGFNPWHKVPILVALHAAGSTADELARNDAPLTRAAAAEQYVAVFPEGGIVRDGGVGKDWADQGCQPSNEAGGDLRFLRALLAEVGREAGVDAKRVFVLGVAEGARVAHHLALAQPDKVTALVAIGAVPPCDTDSAASAPDVAAPKRDVRALLVLPPLTAAPSAAASALAPPPTPSAQPVSDQPPPLVQFWAAANGCAGSPTWVGHPGPQRRLAYACSRAEAEVIWMPLDRPLRRIPARLGTAATMRVVTGFLDRSVSK